MNPETEVAVEETVVAEKPKRVRAAQPKGQKTGEEIMAELAKFQTEVAELEEALAQVPEGNAIHKIASKALLDSRKQWEDALNTVYKFY